MLSSSESSHPSSQSSSAACTPGDGSAKPAKTTRRFEPQLIETVKRTKRAGDTVPATLPTDKTDITPGTKHIYLPKKSPKARAPVSPKPPDNTPNASCQSLPRYLPRREQSMRPHLNTRLNTRQESFHSDLAPIASDEEGEEEAEALSEYEETPSLSGSYGDSSDDSVRRLHLARTRESCDDRFSGYLLALAAKAAEKQLREQALAAFPNEYVHEMVEHFYDREIDGGSDDGSITAVGLLPQNSDGEISAMPIERKKTEIGWALKEMQEHQENLQKMRNEEEATKLKDELRQESFQDPFWTNGMTGKIAAAAAGVGAQDQHKKFELERMQKAAAPPMLGGDIRFRLCPSPKATKMETDQGYEVKIKRSKTGGGLWGGYCVANENQQYLSPVPRGPPMIQTPAMERDDPFATAFGSAVGSPEGISGPPSPNAQRKQQEKGIHLVAGINNRLREQAKNSRLEEEIEREFDDKFVTQVYNYLSLGYPALAWAFDFELSKISLVPIEELRKNDRGKDIKGYMETPEGASEGGHCARWKALKVYVREWARQHPSMQDGGGGDMWGVRARRGSWAI